MFLVKFVLLGYAAVISATTVSSITGCPALPPRATPATSVHDLRIDDIKMVAALGDRYWLVISSFHDTSLLIVTSCSVLLQGSLLKVSRDQLLWTLQTSTRIVEWALPLVAILELLLLRHSWNITSQLLKVHHSENTWSRQVNSLYSYALKSDK